MAATEALAAAGIPSLRFDFPYRAAGRRAPDRPPVLLEAVRDAAADLADRTGLPPDRLVLGGRSMGGRYCSLAVGDPEDPSAGPRPPSPRLSLAPGREAGEPPGRALPPARRAGAVPQRGPRRPGREGRSWRSGPARSPGRSTSTGWPAPITASGCPKSLGGRAKRRSLAEVADVSARWVAGLPASEPNLARHADDLLRAGRCCRLAAAQPSRAAQRHDDRDVGGAGEARRIAGRRRRASAAWW